MPCRWALTTFRVAGRWRHWFLCTGLKLQLHCLSIASMLIIYLKYRPLSPGILADQLRVDRPIRNQWQRWPRLARRRFFQTSLPLHLHQVKERMGPHWFSFCPSTWLLDSIDWPDGTFCGYISGALPVRYVERTPRALSLVQNCSTSATKSSMNNEHAQIIG